MDFGFRKGDAEAEDLAFSIGADAESDEHGAVENTARLTDFFVASIKDDVGESAERARAPMGEIFVKFSSAVADVSGADGGAAKLLQNSGDFASGHALHIHLCESQSESLFAARTTLQSRGVKIDIAADLRDGKSDRPEASGEGLWLEAISIALASVSALKRLSAEHGRTLNEHGLIDEDAKRISEGIGATIREKLQDRFQKFRMSKVGHVV